MIRATRLKSPLPEAPGWRQKRRRAMLRVEAHFIGSLGPSPIAPRGLDLVTEGGRDASVG